MRYKMQGNETIKDISTLGNIIADHLRNGASLHDLTDLIGESCNGWEEYVCFSTEKYNRQLVSRNEYVDVVVISWDSNQYSGLHDHPTNGCIMRVMQGQLQEDVYIREDDKFTLSKTKKILSAQTSFIQGKSGIHNIKNGSEKSVSVHIYSPPNYKLTYYNP